MVYNLSTQLVGKIITIDKLRLFECILSLANEVVNKIINVIRIPCDVTGSKVNVSVKFDD